MVQLVQRKWKRKPSAAGPSGGESGGEEEEGNMSHRCSTSNTMLSAEMFEDHHGEIDPLTGNSSQCYQLRCLRIIMENLIL